MKPSAHDKDPTVNALLNIAEAISSLAEATDGLLYGLKYNKDMGVSVAEALEVGSQAIADGLSGLTNAVEESSLRHGGLDVQPLVDGLGDITYELGDLTKAVKEAG